MCKDRDNIRVTIVGTSDDFFEGDEIHERMKDFFLKEASDEEDLEILDIGRNSSGRTLRIVNDGVIGEKYDIVDNEKNQKENDTVDSGDTVLNNSVVEERYNNIVDEKNHKENDDVESGDTVLIVAYTRLVHYNNITYDTFSFGVYAHSW
eukprot:CAMPEP_0198277436 /NCGR_PEP_ID=MMETSP1447-20131203/65846_1 /TAXON_ID=420782 /ORGANISM="Chaetoceros dichaeta, Strain CCMP1751" /LENGTH=149 /DNA_ID=CAMNT_0043972455 /DNA_START=1199 /DNA_END=1645 /DNA_ORIENTATION=-